MSTVLAKLLQKYSSAEERQVAQIIYDDSVEVLIGDQRLNLLAAHTYNEQMCNKVFAIIEKAIEPTENQWKAINKALLVLLTIVKFGSELAIDKSVEICKYVYPLQEYNSALVKRSSMFMSFSTGGTDYGAPVRNVAKELVRILMNDKNIRQARNEARGGENILVPVGSTSSASTSSSSFLGDFLAPPPSQITFGQGVSSRVGAGHGLEAVPGMYEGRPDRYFDNANDSRRVVTGDSQLTRDAQAPSLLDLAFDNVGTSGNALPEAQFLPALERQAQLERELEAQRAELARLQALQLQQQQQQLLQFQQQQQQQQQQQFPPQQPLLPGQQTHPSAAMDSFAGLDFLQPAPAPSMPYASAGGLVVNPQLYGQPGNNSGAINASMPLPQSHQYVGIPPQYQFGQSQPYGSMVQQPQFVSTPLQQFGQPSQQYMGAGSMGFQQQPPQQPQFGFQGNNYGVPAQPMGLPATYGGQQYPSQFNSNNSDLLGMNSMPPMVPAQPQQYSPALPAMQPPIASQSIPAMPPPSVPPSMPSSFAPAAPMAMPTQQYGSMPSGPPPPIPSMPPPNF